MFRTLVSLACIFLLSCSAEQAEQAQIEDKSDAPDIIFYNAVAYTLDADQPWAEAVAVQGDSIIFVGSGAEALEIGGPETDLIDLGGQMLLPGFIDTHSHPITGGAMAKALSLDTGGTVGQWVAAIAAYADLNPDAEVLFGYGFLATAFGPEGPHREMIDAVVSDRPVLIMDEGFHGAWANSKALEQLQVDHTTPDPEPGFSYFKRDAEGIPTGYLLEGTAMIARDGLDVFNAATVIEGSGVIFDIMNSYGVTAAFDAGAIGLEAQLGEVLEELEASGDMTIRLVGSYRPGGPEDVDAAVQNAQKYAAAFRGDRYHYRMLKIMDDGTVEGRTAAMFEDYQGEPGNAGQTVFTQAQMDQMVVGAANENIDVHIHALGERAVHEALNAVAAARDQVPDTQSRFALCHIQVITDADLPRFKALDVIAQSTPLWASYDEYGKQFVSEDQFNRYWRFNGLKETGARLTFGSDFPASGAGTLGLSPVMQIEIGHTRQNPGEPQAPIQPPVSERLDVAALIRGFTIDAAYQLHMEDSIGSLEPGKKADLVVLNQNLFEVDPYEIHKTEVSMTMLDGAIVYER